MPKREPVRTAAAAKKPAPVNTGKKQARKRRTKKERIMAFLTAYAETCNISAACRKSEVSLTSHYTWMRKHPKYAELFREMKKQAADYLESVAVDRATEGWLEPIYYQGKRCGSVRRYDGGMLQFLLRGMMPDRYGAKIEHSGPAGAPIETKIEVVFLEPPKELDKPSEP